MERSQSEREKRRSILVSSSDAASEKRDFEPSREKRLPHSVRKLCTSVGIYGAWLHELQVWLSSLADVLLHSPKVCEIQ